jgi:hypothetical protein
MIQLTENERTQLRRAASGLTGTEFARLPYTSQQLHLDDINEVIDNLFKTHPESFLPRAVNQWKERQRNREAYSRVEVNHGK